jgi:hypothetical protein
VPEAGQYLIHITLVPDQGQGERLDAHMGFKAGTGAISKTGATGKLMYAFFAAAGIYVIYLFSPGFKRKVDETIAGLKS